MYKCQKRQFGMKTRPNIIVTKCGLNRHFCSLIYAGGRHNGLLFVVYRNERLKIERKMANVACALHYA